MKTPVEFNSAPSSQISEAHIHEQGLVKAFVIAAKRDRMIFLLGHKQKKRRKVVLKSLNHFRDLDPRFAHQVPPSKQSVEVIEQLLRQKGARANCYVISESIDGRFMALKGALIAVVGQGLGTLLSCVPGKLGYFEGEEKDARFILEKPSRDC